MPGRVKILDAAESLFAAKGVDAVSIREIAETAGLSKAAIFHHFESKDVLYQAVVRRSCEGITAVLAQMTQRADGSPMALLADYRRQDLAETLAHADVVRLVLRELTLGRDDQARALAEDVFGEQFVHLRKLVEQAQAEGSLRADIDSGLTAASVVSINLFLFMVWPVLKHLPDTPFVNMEKTAEAMFNLLTQGINNQARGEKT